MSVTGTLGHILYDKNTTAVPRWGWKSPRSLYYLPLFHHMLGGNFKIIHVVRDGRDVALGDNQAQFNGLCEDILVGVVL